jgi:hypothetical protein
MSEIGFANFQHPVIVLQSESSRPRFSNLKDFFEK